MITLTHYLVLGALLFGISAMGIFMNRKNVLVLLMSIELMLFGGELQLYRLLAIFRRYCRTNFRILRTDRCRCRICHRFGDYGAGVPQPTNNQRCRFG